MPSSFSKSILTLLILLFSNHLLAAKFPIGINTNEVMQIDSSVPFINLFKQALPFDEANSKLTHGHIQYDQNGWPKNLNGGQAGSNLLHWLPEGTLPVGNYTVLYDGQGKIDYTDDAKVVSRSPGKDIIYINPGADKFFKVTLIIKQSNPNNYIRNIRVLPPGGICADNPYQRVDNAGACRGNYLAFSSHYQQILFNPDYLRFMKDFDTIRFMNMSGITRNPMTSWNQMPRMEEATWAGKEGKRGAPLEVMVALANKLNRNAWFNIPERANNDLVRRYAQYVKQHLKPNLKVYVEYTNEAWNPQFTAARYVRSMGAKQGLGNDYNGGHRYYVKRAKEVMQIWQQVFGHSNRLVRVLGAWSANPRLTEMFMGMPGVPQSFDVVAVAPYFFTHEKVESQINSVPSVFKLLKDDKNPYSMNNVRKMIQKQQNIVTKHGLKLVAYEGGQHLYTPKNRSSKQVPTKYYIGANRAWPMEQMYTEFLNSWNQVTGGSLFVIFSSPRTYQAYGSWGIKEHINQPISKAPKYRAVKKFL